MRPCPSLGGGGGSANTSGEEIPALESDSDAPVEEDPEMPPLIDVNLEYQPEVVEGLNAVLALDSVDEPELGYNLESCRK